MLVLTKQNIIDLYVWVDDSLLEGNKSLGGRPSSLNNSELITILIWNTLTVKQRNLKDIYRWIKLDYQSDFPCLPNYQNFVKQCHRNLPLMIKVLNGLLQSTAVVRIMDSTMLEVCRLVRANSHKIARNIADFGKNHQGWHYGFKLHTSINLKGQLCGLTLTPASHNDAQQMSKILNSYTKVAVGDGGYTASIMRKHIFETYGTIIISPPHFKQNKKLISPWQNTLLKIRPKIESVFDYLKEHLSLVSSFPRSVAGYLLHYVRILLGYQMMAIS